MTAQPGGGNSVKPAPPAEPRSHEGDGLLLAGAERHLARFTGGD